MGGRFDVHCDGGHTTKERLRVGGTRGGEREERRQEGGEGKGGGRGRMMGERMLTFCETGGIRIGRMQWIEPERGK